MVHARPVDRDFKERIMCRKKNPLILISSYSPLQLRRIVAQESYFARLEGISFMLLLPCGIVIVI